MGNQVITVSQLQGPVHRTEPRESFSGRRSTEFGKAGKIRIRLDCQCSSRHKATQINNRQIKNNSPNYLILTAELKSSRVGEEFVKLQKHCFGLLIKKTKTKTRKKHKKKKSKQAPWLYIWQPKIPTIYLINEVSNNFNTSWSPC